MIREASYEGIISAGLTNKGGTPVATHTNVRGLRWFQDQYREVVIQTSGIGEFTRQTFLLANRPLLWIYYRWVYELYIT
jgi:hypothetical protein